ncbi:MAG: ribosomal-protein-alanine acetyltransferase [Myxococcota bacterium]
MVDVRDACEDDAPTIAATEAAAASHPWRLHQIIASLRADSSLAIVSGTHAHVLMSVAGPSADVLTVAVHPTHQRRGIAHQLLSTVHDRLRDIGTLEVFLEVRTDNTQALRLYERLGYLIVGKRKRYYDDGCDAAVMRLDL